MTSQASCLVCLGGIRTDRRRARELGRNLDHRLVDEHGHGVEIGGVGLQPQPLRLQRNGSAAGKGIVQGGQFVGIEQLGGLRVVLVQFAHLPPRAANLGTGTLQHFLVGGVFPLHEVFDDFEEPLPLDGSFLLVLSVFEPAALLVAGIIDELRKDDRPRRRKWPPCPPKMNAARMRHAGWHFSRSARCIDRIQRKRDFDELAG